MFELKYGKPFLVSLILSGAMLVGMGLSLENLGGTGPGNDATEINFSMEEWDSTEAVPIPDEPDVVASHKPADAASAPKPSEATAQRVPGDMLHPQAQRDVAKTPTEVPRRQQEWARQKPIESDESSDEPAVMSRGKSPKATEKVIGNDVTSDPNANGNGITESDQALAFMSPAALDLLPEGLRQLLKPTPIVNAKDFLIRVQEQGRNSSLRGRVVVRMNFAPGGAPITSPPPRILDDSVDPAVKQEALRIVTSSGNIINNSGEPKYLAVPVVLGPQ